MPDILNAAQATTPLLPPGIDLPYSTHGSGLPPEPEPEPAIPPPVPKKHGNKSLILAVLLFLLGTLPLLGYYVTQQQRVTSLRSRAAAKCDNWAESGSFHDNIQTCRKYKCDNGTWKDVGTANHPNCTGEKHDAVLGDGKCEGGENETNEPACRQIDSGQQDQNQSGGSGETSEQCTLRLTQCGASGQTKCDECGGGCDPGYKTDGSQCIPVKATNACGNNADCAAGQICQAGACIVPQAGGAGEYNNVGGGVVRSPDPTSNQCQNGTQNRDQDYWLICECANGCTQKTDASSGGGGTGWVCDQKCTRVPKSQRPTTTCNQIDFVHQGTSEYCGVAEINCPASCQTGGVPAPGAGQQQASAPQPEATAIPPPTATATPTPPPGGTCELIRVYDSAGSDITGSIAAGTKKLAIGEQITVATSKGNATKARFRIQGIADWAENDPAKTTATEYRLSINIPSTLTQAQGTFEVEVFVNGVWK